MVTAKESDLADLDSPCEFCGNKSKFRCSSCKKVLYCGRKHQIQDWENHRVICKVYEQVKEIKNAKRHRVDAIMKSKRRESKRVTKPAEEKRRPALFVAQNRHKFQNVAELAVNVVEDLTGNGFAVIDHFVHERIVDAILLDLKELYRDGSTFLPGMLNSEPNDNVGTAEGKTESIRGDMVSWIDIHRNTEHIAMKKAVMCMNSVIKLLNKSAPTLGCNIKSRSRVMAACYPGNGARYKQHVDNPNGDGRKLTFILYLNKDYDQKRDGGVLRMHPKGSSSYFDIEPVAGRLVIFWSDYRNPHEVLPVYRERFAISVWYFDIVERAKSFVTSTFNRSHLAQHE